MTSKERLFIIFILSFIALIVTFDLFTDSKEGVAIWHVVVEASAGVAALLGVFYFLKNSVNTHHQLSKSLKENNILKRESEEWKAEAKKYIEGLSQSIDLQLTKWNLSEAEKEIALLLLKGLSLKEIAEIRQTSEKTARAQSLAVYAKSGLSGRAELAAFFLEDLLQPQNINNL